MATGLGFAGIRDLGRRAVMLLERVLELRLSGSVLVFQFSGHRTGQVGYGFL